MPVKFFIGRDVLNQTHYPETSHESRGVREICEFLWRGWQHDSSRHYAIIASLQRLQNGRKVSADLVIISETGVGVVELKDYYGGIRCDEPEGAWFAGPQLIKAGAKTVEEGGHANPYQQAHAYADVIRQGMLAEGVLPGKRKDQEKYSFHTAVCFTNPDARIELCQRVSANPQWRKKLPAWEEFSILKSSEISAWASDLRFGANKGRSFNYLLQEWSDVEVYALAEGFFGARPWIEMTSIMPPLAQPMAYLSLIEGDRIVSVYSIVAETVTIGRANESLIKIPEAYPGVSREHAIIRREVGGFFIEDVSKNGTYIGRKRLGKHKAHALEEDCVVQLGRKQPNGTACRLRFSLKAPPSPPTTFG